VTPAGSCEVGCRGSSGGRDVRVVVEEVKFAHAVFTRATPFAFSVLRSFVLYYYSFFMLLLLVQLA